MNLEQCQKLKEWGFSQIGTISQWAYYRILNGTDVEEIELCYSVQHHTKELVAKCPDLECLLEFAQKIIWEHFDDQHWLLLQSPFADYPHWSAYATKTNEYDDEEAWIVKSNNPDPKQAVYELLEKVMEK